MTREVTRLTPNEESIIAAVEHGFHNSLRQVLTDEEWDKVHDGLSEELGVFIYGKFLEVLKELRTDSEVLT